MDKQLELAQKVIDVVDRATKKIWVTLRWYSVDKPESFYAQARFFAREKKDEKFQQVFYVIYKFDALI